MMTTGRAVLDPEVVRRHNDLADLYNGWPDDPDDDPEFVAEAREIMGLPPLEDDFPALRSELADFDDDEVVRALAQAFSNLIYRRFDPGQLRAPAGTRIGGEWIRDLLGLAKRIDLGDGETFAGSDLVEGSDSDLLAAWTVGPNGRSLRLGVGIAEDDRRRWKAADKGSTVVLDETAQDRLKSALRQMVEASAVGEKRRERREDLEARRVDVLSRRGLSRRDASRLTELDEQVEVADIRLRGLAENIRERTARINAGDEDSRFLQSRNVMNQREVEQVSARRERLSAERDRLTAGAGPLSEQDQVELAQIEVDLQDVGFDDSDLISGTVPARWGDLEYSVHLDEDYQPNYDLAVAGSSADGLRLDHDAVLDLLKMLGGDVARAFYGDSPGERIAPGRKGGGRFRKLTDRLTDLLQEWVSGDGPDDPLDEFSREQLRDTAKKLADKARADGDSARAARLTPRRMKPGEDPERLRTELKVALYQDVKASRRGGRDVPGAVPKKVTPAKKAAPRKAAPKAPDVDLSTLDDPEALRDALDLKKVPELKDMIHKQNETLPAGQKLALSGRKRELVDRLVEHHAPGKTDKAPTAPAVPDAEEKARDRQAQIDAKRKVADGVGEVLELLDNGVSPTALRHRISASGLDDASKARLLAAVDGDVDERVRAGYAATLRADTLATGRRVPDGTLVKLADLREELDSVLSRDEVDAALVRLRRQGVRVVGEGNQKTLTQRDRDASVVIGNQPKHLIAFDDTTPRPSPLDAAAKDLATVAGLAQIGEHGTPMGYDPKRHTFVGDQPRPGQKVAVIRPGYVATIDGGPVVFKAKVETWDDSLHGPAAPAEPVARPSGLPAKPTAADFEDLAERVFRLRTADQVYDYLRDLNATELARLARKFPGDAMMVPGVLKTSDRRQGLRLPDTPMSLDEKRRWLADKVKDQRFTWRSEDPDDEEVLRASSALDGDELQAYWTRGKGLARWSTHPHPWRRLRGLLRKHPRIRDPEGLASHYFKIVFGIWPGERKGSNPVGPG